MGTPDFSVPTLQALIDAGHEVAAVYTQPPRPAGRGKKLRPSPVQIFAESKNIPVFSPTSLRSAEEQERFSGLNLDAAVVVAYGLILPKAILDAPRLGCINVHASLLPRWRGAAPIQRAIMAGDLETGVSIMQMDAGLDTGAVLGMTKTPITPDDTAGSLHDRLSQLGASVICDMLAGLADGSVTPTPQPAEGVTYAEKIRKEEGRIDWNHTAPQVSAHIRGLTPFPGAWFEFAGNRIKILQSNIHECPTGFVPGSVVSTPLVIACASGCLDVTLVQREGKSPMSANELLRGFPIPPGSLIHPAP